MDTLDVNVCYDEASINSFISGYSEQRFVAMQSLLLSNVFFFIIFLYNFSYNLFWLPRIKMFSIVFFPGFLCRFPLTQRTHPLQKRLQRFFVIRHKSLRVPNQTLTIIHHTSRYASISPIIFSLAFPSPNSAGNCTGLFTSASYAAMMRS